MPKKATTKKKAKKAMSVGDVKKFQQRNFSKPGGFKGGAK